jgi:prevent-host-death family protein
MPARKRDVRETPPARTHFIGAFDAKTRLGELLDRCERGESVVITRHGHPVARLVPFSLARDQAAVDAAIDRLEAFGEGIRLPKDRTIRDLIDEGRP